MTILGRLHAKGLLDPAPRGQDRLLPPRPHARAEYADLRAQAEVAALVDDVRRRRAQPLRSPGRRARPRAPRRPSSGWPVAAEPRGRWLYRLQLALGAGRDRGVHRSCSRRPCSAVHVHPAAAHRLDVAGLAPDLPGGQRAPPIAAPASSPRSAPPSCAVAVARRGAPVPRAPAAAARAPGHRRAAGPPDRRSSSTSPRRSPSAPAGCARACTSRPAVLDRLVERRAAGRPRPRAAPRRAARPAPARASSRVLCQALFFLPVLRPLHDRYADVAEITADAAALEALRRRARVRSPRRCSRSARDRRAAWSGSRPSASTRSSAARRAWRLPRLLLVAALLTLVALVALAWRAERSASVQATLNLPIASSQPCVLVLGARCLVLAVPAGARRRRRDLRAAARRVASQRLIYYVCSITFVVDNSDPLPRMAPSDSDEFHRERLGPPGYGVRRRGLPAARAPRRRPRRPHRPGAASTPS